MAKDESLFCWIYYFGGARLTAWQRAGREDVSPAAQPSPSLLIGGTRAPFFRTTRLPSADELFVGMFGVTRDIDLPIAEFLDVVGIGRATLIAFSRRLASLQLHRADLVGNQRRTRPLVVGTCSANASRARRACVPRRPLRSGDHVGL